MCFLRSSSPFSAVHKHPQTYFPPPSVKDFRARFRSHILFPQLRDVVAPPSVLLGFATPQPRDLGAHVPAHIRSNRRRICSSDPTAAMFALHGTDTSPPTSRHLSSPYFTVHKRPRTYFPPPPSTISELSSLLKLHHRPLSMPSFRRSELFHATPTAPSGSEGYENGGISISVFLP